VAEPRRQINITPDPQTYAFLQAQADELELPISRIAARLLSKAAAEMCGGPLVPTAPPDLGNAMAEIDRKLSGLIRAHYNATVRLLLGLGIPRATVASFCARNIRLKAAPLSEEANNG
jgi:hypothetical protein